MNKPSTCRRFCGRSLLRFEHKCIFLNGCFNFLNWSIFYSMASSINASVNYTFSVTLLVTVPHLLVTEAFLLNIFTRVLRSVQNDSIFFLYKKIINPTREIRPPYLGKTRAAARTVLPIDTGMCSILCVQTMVYLPVVRDL